MTDSIAIAPPSLLRRVFDNRLARFLTLFVVAMAADVAAWAVPPNVIKFFPGVDKEIFMAAATAIAAVVMLIVYALLVRGMEHRRADELALRAAPSGIVGGAAIGLGLFVTVIAVLWQLGVAHVDSTPGQPLLAAGRMAVLTAVGEELVFRGILFRIFEEMFGSFTALLVSAGLFGLAHMGNPGATLQSGMAIMLEAGLLLAACYMWARNLWLPVGLHFGWNFAEGGLFGGEVSGQKFAGLFHTTLTGPELLSGGKFGAEGSMVAVGLCMVAAATFLTLAIRRHEWRGFRLAINDRG